MSAPDWIDDINDNHPPKSKKKIKKETTMPEDKKIRVRRSATERALSVARKARSAVLAFDTSDPVVFETIQALDRLLKSVTVA